MRARFSPQLAAILLLLCAPALAAQKFYPDDPLWKMPPPRSVGDILNRRVNDYYDFFRNTFSRPEERPEAAENVPAQAVNTLGEVPDSEWYTNRHYHHPMTTDELARGANSGRPPSTDAPWQVVAAKSEGVTPGFTIQDASGRRYVIKFDPFSNPEMATGAEMISSKFFHALGYFVPENYLVEFAREQLTLAEGVRLQDERGQEREMSDRDVTEILLKVPRTATGRYRAVASLYLRGRPVGPFRYYGTRRDDPNDVVPHERRRDLRGLSVFAAWLGHDDSRSINTLDMVVSEDDRRFVRHYLIDFGSTLGSASTGPNSPRSGHEYLFAWKPAMQQLFTFGLAVPDWARARFPDVSALGRFEAETFDPENWVPEYRNAAFSNRLPDDAFWAARQVMAFTDWQIYTIVKTAAYSDPDAERWITAFLIERRDRIGKAFLEKVLPLDRFTVRGGRLAFEDLGLQHKLVAARNYDVRWMRFDNATGRTDPLPGENTLAIPAPVLAAAPGQYFAARIHGGDPGKSVTVYLRTTESTKEGDEFPEVVGIDRSW